jgi:gliding motility-associated-like protein
VSCPDSSDGHIVIDPVGGTPGNTVPYTYSIDGIHYYTNHNFYDLAAGAYHVYVMDSPGCVFDTLVYVYQPFPVTVSINPQDSLIALGSSIQLFTVINNISTQSINSYSWSPANGLNCLDCPNPVSSPYQTTTYYLTVNYGKNCTTTSSDKIEVGPGPDVYIPNAFTPNGDGVNDVFSVFGTTLQSVGMKIFNRWGEKVFDSGDSQWASWDGTFKGVSQPSGVYVYYVELVYLDVKKKFREGSVTLIR